MRRVVVVGASLAGVHAVEALREAGFDGEVTLIDGQRELPYDRPPLSKAALRDGPVEGEHLLRPVGWYDDHAIALRLGQAAVGLDPAARSVLLEGGARLGYDGLVLATGSTARTLGHVAGAAAAAHVLRTTGDCARLHARLLPGARLVVIGAGFIGLEVAATAREMGLEVSVVELAPAPLARVLGDEVGNWLLGYHAARGIDIRCGTSVESIDASGKVRLRGGTTLAADVIAAGVGALPATGWLRGSGLRLSDGVVCDQFLHTSLPGVVAAGDIARWYNPLFDQELRVEQWTNAVEQGRYAALSLLGAVDAPYASAPYFWSDQFGAKIRFVGTSSAAQQVEIKQADDNTLVALFGRDDVVCGALCVNAPRALAAYRRAIVERLPWQQAVLS
ncbi:MAG: NAD(P)/FAD-dependent oxidoreductase [Trebonia sp.]